MPVIDSAKIKFIGRIHSSLKSVADCPLQEDENAPQASITIFPEFIEGIQNIEEGSEILLLTWLHQADRQILKTKPRNDPAAPLTGVFSTRSPDRPNPVGLHSAKVLAISEDGVIRVARLEVMDETPLIDIKPVKV